MLNTTAFIIGLVLLYSAIGGNSQTSLRYTGRRQVRNWSQTCHLSC